GVDGIRHVGQRRGDVPDLIGPERFAGALPGPPPVGRLVDRRFALAVGGGPDRPAVARVKDRVADVVALEERTADAPLGPAQVALEDIDAVSGPGQDHELLRQLSRHRSRPPNSSAAGTPPFAPRPRRPSGVYVHPQSLPWP